MEPTKEYIEKDAPEEALLLAYLRDSLSKEGRRQVEAWLQADPSHEKRMLQTARMYYAQHTLERIGRRSAEAAYRRVETRLRKRYYLGRFRQIGAAAACLLAGFLLSTALYLGQPHAPQAEPQEITLEAKAGMQTHFDLPDGTVVYLNSGSSLSYLQPLDRAERKVKLSGEAYFKVVRDTEHPFIVSTAGDRYQVRVVGTEFNVQAYQGEDRIETTLVKGAVNLSIRLESGKSYEQKLHPSEKAVYDRESGRLAIEKVDPAYETAWIDGKLLFKNTPLPEVLRELANYYNVEFEVRLPDTAGYRFTGVFRNRQLSQILDYLKITSRIDYEIVDPMSDTAQAVNRTHVILREKKK